MRGLVVLIAIVAGMLIAGWLTFHRGNGTATVTVETGKIEADTSRLVNEGRQVLDDAADRLKGRLEKSDSPAQPAETPVGR